MFNLLQVQCFQPTCLKYKIEDIESMIQFNYKNRLHNNSNSKKDANNNATCGIIEKFITSDNHSSQCLGLSSDSETDSHLNNSLNVYGMQTNINGRTVNYTEVKVPYKLGDCMYMINNQKVKKQELKINKNLENLQLNEKDTIDNKIVNKQKSAFETCTNSDINKQHDSDYLKKLSRNSSPNLDNEDFTTSKAQPLTSRNKSVESFARKNFYIHQSEPDKNQFDLYSREKDELCSFVCHGKQAEIVDADYQDMYDIKPKLQNGNTGNNLYELMINLSNDRFNSFVHIKDDLILLATDKAEFNLLRPNKSKWDFIRCVIASKFNGNDAELYKQGLKTLVDLCLDSKGNLIQLNKWKSQSFKKCVPNAIENNNQNDFTFKYTVELFSFDKKITDGITYIKTLCCLSDEKPPTTGEKTKPSEFSACSSTPTFTRVYNDEKTNCIILIDNSNSKIYWFRKANGTKRRCLKSEDSTLKDPKSIAFINSDDTNFELIFICTRNALVASNKHLTIKHERFSMLVDIYFDTYEKCLVFIDSSNVYGGRVFQKANEKASNNISDIKLCDNSTNCLSQFAQMNLDSMDLRYKLIFSQTFDKLKYFKRVISTKNYLFILCDYLNDSKTSIFAIDRNQGVFS